MFKKANFIFLILLVLATCLSAQKKVQFSQTPADKLAKAKEIQRKSPEQAIRLLEDVIGEKRKGTSGYEAQAYMLMGAIYEEIEEEELAVERYRQAQLFIPKKESELWAENLFRLGKLDLKAQRFQKSEQNFNRCIEEAPQSKWAIQCQEGLADISFAQDDFDASLQQIDAIQSGYLEALDSTALSRLEAKRSQNFIQQNKIPEAAVALNNSATCLPSKASNEGYNYLNQTSELFWNASVMDEVQVAEAALQQKIDQQLQAEAIIPDQLLLADLYLERQEVQASERFVNDAKMQLATTQNPKLEAMVYQKSAAINAEQKNYQKAFEDLQKHVDALQQQSLVEQTQTAKKVDIFKGQRKIDLLEKDMALEAKEAQILHTQLRNQKIVNGLLATLLLAALVSFFYIMQNVRAKRRANQRLLLQSLRSQMNPHFLFNALNSVNGFIIKNDERAANKFLSNFSKLMRQVLDNSQEDFISLEEEISLLDLYLKLEHSRFRDKFDYVVEKNVDNSTLSLKIPPMLIQPFIENAVWHGLRYKKEKGKLRFSISETEKELLIHIEDNGIGRAQSKALKTDNQKKYKSTGLQNIGERIQVINDLYNKNYQIEVQDLQPNETETGTLVCITIPK